MTTGGGVPLLRVLADQSVQLYLVVLALAIRKCLGGYLGSMAPGPSPATAAPSKGESASPPSTTSSPPRAFRLLPILLSVSILTVTWCYIFRFLLGHYDSSESYFDDAYRDVLRSDGHYFTSTQLLTWAIVATAWVGGNVDGDTGGVSGAFFLVYGFLGALSAAFALWVPARGAVAGRGGRGGGAATVPATYVASSAIAFTSILRLSPCECGDGGCDADRGFGSFRPGFRFWLQTLHCVLLAPLLLSLLVPALDRRLRVPTGPLFAAMAAAFAWWHVAQQRFYAPPATDCQISITVDLVCCTLLTLLAVHQDSPSASSGILRLAGAAALIPLLSPAAVLAGHLALRRLPKGHAAAVSALQRSVSARLRDKEAAARAPSHSRTWCNLGLWTASASGGKGSGYNEACENLAAELGRAADLGAADGVLACGCGSTGDEVRYYRETFGLRHITGIDPSLEKARGGDEDDHNARWMRAEVEDLASSSTSSPLFPRGYFDKVIALDNVYHYESKDRFFRDCANAVLPPGGTVAVSDIVLTERNRAAPAWVKLALCLMGIPRANMWSVKEYCERLESIGYVDVKVRAIGEDVFNGWRGILPGALLRHLDYVIVVATAPAGDRPSPKKKRVAIVGSGLAGLATAHRLATSATASDIVIDVYEANERPGLSGSSTFIGDQLVDVPARMAALGYYDRYLELLDELAIPTAVVRTDSSFYGTDASGDRVCHFYDRTSIANLYNAVFVGGPWRLWQLVSALSTLPRAGDADASKITTFGDWLQEHFNLWPKGNPQENEGKGKGGDLPSLTCHENPFVYIMVGSLCWMLSCTYEQLARYPADIVLPYCRGLNMSRLGLFRQGQVVRVVPSIRVLEQALLYGVNHLSCGNSVQAIDESRSINGIAYDAVVCATEAKAVHRVVKGCTDVFGEIQYHPSEVYLHKDVGLMPPERSDWRCWNVEMSTGRPEPQLTFHLNAYFSEADLGGEDVFQTWSPVREPHPMLTIRRSSFQRVVHGRDARRIASEIDKLQGGGERRIYYAGSYAVHGMGLLEQALVSGEKVADLLLGDLFPDQ